MAQTKLIGGGTAVQGAPGVELGVDPTFSAARMSFRPLDHGIKGNVLGHYAVAQLSGAIAATPTALDPHASIRWAPSNTSALLVLMRVKAGWHCISAITLAVRMSYQLSIARGFTVDYVTGSTAISMTAVQKTNAMRASMGSSLMGTAGPRITTTGAMSAHTNTLDAAPFAITNWTVPGILTGTATVVAGVAGPMQTLYEWTGLGQHPVVLSNQEGVVMQLTHTGWGTGTVSLVTQWEWAEVEVF